MRRDFARRKLAARRVSPRRGRYRLYGVLATGVALVLIGAALGYRQVANAPWVVASVAHVKTWLAERHQHLHQHMTQVKQLAANKPAAEPAIHFEFYTALPNMQVSRAEPLVQTATPPSIAPKVVSAKDVEQALSQQIKNMESK